jgi:hypothetical protein
MGSQASLGGSGAGRRPCGQDPVGGRIPHPRPTALVMPLDLARLATIDPDALPDDQLRPTLRLLLGVVEELVVSVQELRTENQRLRDEINRLKGVPGRPPAAPPRTGPAGTDHSSEAERRQPRTWHKGSKRDQLTITRTERLRVDRATLPPDAVYKGIEAVVVQDLTVQVDTIRFEREVWYSPGQRRRYQAPLPAGYTGQFGPHLKALAVALHYGANVTEAKLGEFFGQAGVRVSRGFLGGLLAPDPARAPGAAFMAQVIAEARAVERAGLASSPWQHLDATGTRVDGEPWHCHVLGNPLFTAYHTTPTKDRLAVLDVLQGNPGARRYRLDTVAEAYLERAGLAPTARARLADWPRDRDLDAATVTRLLEAQRLVLGPQQQTRIREGLALAAYHAQGGWPVIRTLVCDDAPQFRLVTDDLALCWVHEGRHYTKLIASLPPHQRALDDFRRQFWDYYRALLAYRQRPTAADHAWLERRFDALFGTATGFRLLDERIALTREKKDALLRVLAHPELPLHNNPAELAARRRVRKRDASFGPRSDAGIRAWDTFHTLAATTQQLGVSFSAYLKDRFTAAGRIPPLAGLLTARAATLSLGASWAPA